MSDAAGNGTGASPPGGHRLPALMTVAAVLVIWFLLLGYRDLFDPDEGRYAEIPREMLASGDWVTPRLQGLKYFEKPPLQYWATALAYQVGGQSSATARLWTALLGFAGVLWTAWLGRRLFGRDAGDYAFLITASGLLYFAAGHVLTLDMGLAFFLTLAMGSLALAQTQREQPEVVRNWMLLAWAALAGAVLSKGLVGLVLPAGAVGVYLLWQRDWALLRHLHMGKGLAVLVALCAPWFVMVSRANHDFAEFFFVHEHWQRFASTSHHRQGPFYYFLGIFLLGALPWLGLAVKSLIRPGLSRRPAGGFQADRLFWVYAVFILVFFSISRSKLPAYILPLWPFVALLAGRHAAGLSRWRVDAWVLLGCAAVLGAAAAALPEFVTDTTPVELLLACRPWVIAAAIWTLLGALILLVWRGPLKVAMAGTALCAMLSVQMLLWGMQSLAPSRSGHPIAQSIESLHLPPGTPLYLVGTYTPSLAFYLNQQAVIVDHVGELAFGIGAEPERTIRSPAEFATHWRQDSHAVAVISNRHPEYLDLGLRMHIVATGPRHILVTKDARALQAAKGD